MTSLYQKISSLPVSIEEAEFELLEKKVSSDFTRLTTLVQLRGKGKKGVGEDVTYGGENQKNFQDHGPTLELTGKYTLEEFSRHVDQFELFSDTPDQKAYENYRRWAIESAALDLALRQSDLSLKEALDREARPLRYVVSLRLPNPPTTAPLAKIQQYYPGLEIKLDFSGDWTEEFIEELAHFTEIVAIDFKGAYQGTIVDQPPRPRLYQKVVETLPEIWLEDPALNDETHPILKPYRRRITWDAILHSLEDIENLPFPPEMINIKPSRFGTIEELFAVYEYCQEKGIGAYGGGQFELGPGRGQIQYLASLFHPDTANDVAPKEFNQSQLPPGLPMSPLEPQFARLGFRWERRREVE